MSIQVNDFRWEPGTNDAEYIKLLESSRDDWERIAQKAISKLKTLSKAQEPRVMTLREWISAPEPADGECMCYEIKDKGLQAMLVKAFDGVRHLYGNAFRVWTTKPSLKQMEETPWA